MFEEDRTILPPISSKRSNLPADAAAVIAMGGRLRSLGAQSNGTLAGSSARMKTTSLSALVFPSSASSSASPIRGDTMMQWRTYHKEATAHEGNLDRGPRWKSETRVPELAMMTTMQQRETKKESCVCYSPDSLSWAADAHTKRLQSRRDLKKQLREAKDFIDLADKRGFVQGLVARKDAPYHLAAEQRKVTNSMQRIEGAIRDCRTHTCDIHELQRQMAAVVMDRSWEDAKEKYRREVEDSRKKRKQRGALRGSIPQGFAHDFARHFGDRAHESLMKANLKEC